MCTSASHAPEVAWGLLGGARRDRRPRGRYAARGSLGRGRDASWPQVGSCVSSPAGARAGHGGLCGPAGPGCMQPLVVSVADRGPGAEAILCGRWSWGLPTSGDHDTEASFVPVRDGARGRARSRERVPSQGGGQEAQPADGVCSSTRERVLAGRRPAQPGTCARNRERSVVQSPALSEAGLEGELVILSERILPPRVRVSERCC